MEVSEGYDAGWEVAYDTDGSSFVCGVISGQVDIYGATDTLTIGTGNQINLMLAKWYADHTLAWAVSWQNKASLFYFNDVSTDADGNVYLCGAFIDEFDADPGENVHLLTANGEWDGMLIKLNPDGAFLWALSVEGNDYDVATEVAVDKTGNVVVLGNFGGTFDFDPGPGNDIISSPYGAVFVWKLDRDGNHQWVRTIEATDSYYYGLSGQSIITDGDGNVLTTGAFSSTVDFDPGPGELLLFPVNYSDVFVQKLSPEGDLVWARSFGSFASTNIAVDASNNVYTAGSFDYVADFDPGPLYYHLMPDGYSNDIFIQKMDSGGNFLWAVGFGNEEDDYPWGFDVDSLGNTFTAGEYHYYLDLDPGAGYDPVFAEGDYDVFVQCLNADGTYAWGKSIGGFAYDTPNGLAVDKNSEVLLTGWFEDAVDFDPGPGTRIFTSNGFTDAYLLKLNAVGDYVWATTFGSSEGEIVPNKTATDVSGNIIIAGAFYGTVDVAPGDDNHTLKAQGFVDGFIQKLDAEGKFIWALGLGGTDYDAFTALHVDASKNIYAAGMFTGIVDLDPGPGSDLQGEDGRGGWFILKLDADGQYLWAKTLPGDYFTQSLPRDMTVDAVGNVYLTGYFEGEIDFDPGPGVQLRHSEGSYDIAVLKLDPDGNFLWVQTAGHNKNDLGTSIALDAAGNVVVGGVFSGNVDFDPGPGHLPFNGYTATDGFVEKFDPQGNFLWAKQFGNIPYDAPINLYEIAAAPNGNVYLAGSFEEALDVISGPQAQYLMSNGLADGFLVEIDSNGNHVQSHNFGSIEDDAITGLCLDNDGNIYMSGNYSWFLDFDPSPTEYYILETQGFQPFLFKLDTSLSFQWAVGFPISYVAEILSIAVDAHNNPVAAGYFFNGSIDCDPGPEEYLLTTGTWNTFIFKLIQTTVSVDEFAGAVALRAWPNPTTGPLTIDLGEQPLDVEVTVTGLEGKLLKRQYFENAQTLDVPLDGLMPGVYFVQVRGEGILATAKVVKQ